MNKNEREMFKWIKINLKTQRKWTKGDYIGFYNKDVNFLINLITRIEQFDIEDFIKNLKWSKYTTDWEKTLVAGNLRNFYRELLSHFNK